MRSSNTHFTFMLNRRVLQARYQRRLEDLQITVYRSRCRHYYLVLAFKGGR